MVRRGARSVRYLVSRHILRRRHLVARSSHFGLKLRFRTEDVVGRHIYKRGVHEEALTRFLLAQEFGPDDVVFDIGAHIGWHSLILDRVLPPGARVYAFEPDPENFDLLRENLRRNDADRVVPVHSALSDEEGAAWLHRYPAKNLGKHSLLPLHGGERVKVSTTTLDAFWRDEGLDGRVPRLIKLDVEGFEHQVLRGAEGALERTDMVIAEHAPELQHRAGLDPLALQRLMTDLGFRAYHLLEEGPVPVNDAAPLSANGTSEVLWRKEAHPIQVRPVEGNEHRRRQPRRQEPRTNDAPSAAADQRADVETEAVRPRLSVILITLNEEKHLPRTLESVAWADEIVVVDSGSTDRTEAVARRYTDHFYVREWDGYGKQKERALSLASGEWVLSIDADEVVSLELRREIEEVLRAPDGDAGYEMRLHTWMMGRWLGTRGWYAEWKLRLFRRDLGGFAHSLVHERVEVDGAVGRLTGILRHYHDRGIRYEVDRMNRYSSLAARQLSKRGVTTRGIGAALLRGCTYFIQAYFVKGLVVYGRAGLTQSLLRGYYGFLKYAKLWEIGRSGPDGDDPSVSSSSDPLPSDRLFSRRPSRDRVVRARSSSKPGR